MGQVILVQEEPRGPSELIEVAQSLAGNFRLPFPDNQQLRSLLTQNVIVQGIKVLPPGLLTNGPITGLPTSPLTELAKCVLVLYCEGWEKGHYIPLLELNDVDIATTGTPHRYSVTKFANWKNVDWSKSYILYANGTGGSVLTGGTANGYCFLVEVLYVKLDAAGQEIIGPS